MVKNNFNCAKIKSVIQKNYHNLDFGVTALAEKTGMSASYLGEITGIHFNMSPQALIETVRLEASLKLLAGEDRVYQICSQVGYMNCKTFRIAFKKRLQKTPSQCRKMLQASGDVKREIQAVTAQLWNGICQNFR